MRLDLFLKHQNYTDSREKASEIIKNGNVKVNNKIIKKPAYKIKSSDKITITNNKIYVARSAYKLLSVFQKHNLNIKNLIALDLGSSTGGFVQILLEQGVKKVYAIDVGKDQLHIFYYL